MVATTFAADTPLAVTELVAQNGIAGNWLWWNMILGGMLTVFFFARLWRRSGILTDCEFVVIRYSGKAASFLRGFRAVYIGIFMNVIVIAWVNLAMVKILSVIFPELKFFGVEEVSFLGFTFGSHLLTVGCLMAFVAVYSALSGLWGVSITDSFQFVMAMTGCIVLAVFAVKHESIGGLSGLREKLPEWVFKFTPEISGSASTGAAATGLLKMSVTAFVAYLGVQWWASWYPGAEPGGGGYIAQRMMSAKNEKHSLLATLWFNVAHYALRPWPWVIVALCSLVFFPELAVENKGAGFVMVIVKVLPSGLIGLLMAAFFAAYMSTIASQTVWGTSYIVNDLYRPFIRRGAGEKYYVKVEILCKGFTYHYVFADGFITSGDIEAGEYQWCVEVYPGVQRRYRSCFDTALVLVANKRVVGDISFDSTVCSVPDSDVQGGQLRGVFNNNCGVVDDGMDDGDIFDTSYRRREAYELLQEGASGRRRLEVDIGEGA
jgi:Na+/proline symporter